MKRRMAVFFVLLSLFICNVCQAARPLAEKVRQPAVAGQFYPGSRSDLEMQIKSFLDQADAPETEREIIGLWVPHAGYIFSGQVAANAFHTVQNRLYDVIVLVGASHRTRLRGGSIGPWIGYKTPLGIAPVDRETAEAIKKNTSLISEIPEAHRYEHSLEVQIPFVQIVQPGVPVVPLILDPGLSFGDAEIIAGAIAAASAGKKVLLVASSDMSHYPDYKDAYDVDLRMLDTIKLFDPKKILHVHDDIMRYPKANLSCVLCGRSALVTVMLAAEKMGADESLILPYMNSGDISGERGRVVGYGAALFTGDRQIQSNQREIPLDEISFTTAEKKKLMQIARQSIECILEGKDIPEFDVAEPNLNVKRGVFVTLTNGGRLRGCIGHFGQEYPLYHIVSEMAVAAAVQDPRFRFNPVSTGELEQMEIKISILSPLKKISNIDEIEIGRHGIWICKGARSGTYLPEVATEMGWDRTEFLNHCCHDKAGLPPDAWKRDAEIYIYSSQILSEKAL